mmetsp:Transcript_86833/g.173376  ORF Transcript_86833/g.173376 Transcript_86833/m.173376 type:complete len:105 (-) Transcript_86833:1234-1548(-)
MWQFGGARQHPKALARCGVIIGLKRYASHAIIIAILILIATILILTDFISMHAYKLGINSLIVTPLKHVPSVRLNRPSERGMQYQCLMPTCQWCASSVTPGPNL